MPVAADRPEAPTAIRTDLGAIFVSLELSRSTWLITSLSPGGGEKMSKHPVRGGDIAGSADAVCASCRRRREPGPGRCFPIIVIQEAGLDGFWIHRVLQDEGIESHVVDPASIATSRRRRRAKTDKIDGEALVRDAAGLQARRAAGVCDGQGADARGGGSPPHLPRAQDADRRAGPARQPHQRACCSPRGSATTSPCTATGGSGWKELHDRRWSPAAGASEGARSAANSTGSSCCSSRSRRSRPSGMRCLLAAQEAVAAGTSGDAARPERHRSGVRRRLWSEGLFRHFDNRRQVAAYAGLAPTPWQSGSVDREQGVSKAGNPRLRTTHDPAGLALAAASAATRRSACGSDERVSAQRRPPEEDDDRGAGPQAAGRAVEVRDRRRRHRGSRHEDRLTRSRPPDHHYLPGPDQSWRIQVDEPSKRMA